MIKLSWYEKILLSPVLVYYWIKGGSEGLDRKYEKLKEDIAYKKSLTPLHVVVISGDISKTQELVSKSDINLIDTQKRTPLFYSVENRNLEITKLLLSHSANPNLYDKKRLSPAKIAIKNGDLESLKLLIHSGAKIHFDNEESLLHFACRLESKNKQIILFLLENKANPNAKDSYKNTPLMNLFGASIENKNELIEIAKLLLQKGADINSKGSYDRTLLHQILARRSYDILPIVEFLVENGASPYSKDEKGEDSFDELENGLSQFAELKEYMFKKFKRRR
jgi:ankyrin repeat protein